MLRQSVKGQNLSISVLIIAALAITVLIVVSFIFFRGTSEATESLNSCEQQGGRCVLQSEGCGSEAQLPRACPDTDSDEPQTCCTRDLFAEPQ